MSSFSSEALYSKKAPGFLLSDDEALQYVYNELGPWAEQNDDSGDDSMFHEVCITILCYTHRLRRRQPCEFMY